MSCGRELAKALEACKRHKARLVIAKLDRLSRNLAFIATLMEAGVEFLAVDNPHANKLTVHILAAVAQHEREMISERTTAALQAAKARGVRLGNPNLSEAAAIGRARAQEAAQQRADNVLPVIRELQAAGATSHRHCLETERAQCADAPRSQVVARSSGRRAGAIGLGAAELSPERDSEQLLIAVVGCGVFVATANAHNHRAVCLGRAYARPVLCDIA
jgi:hypothetical protein